MLRQDWFLRVIASRAMFEPGKIKGSFGAYVRRSALKELYKRLRDDSRQKRGGQFQIESLESHPRLLESNALAEDELFDTLCADHHLKLALAMVEALWRSRGKGKLWEALSPVLAAESTLEQALVRLKLKSLDTLEGHFRVLRAEMLEALQALDRSKPGDPELDRWLALLNKGGKT